jgi:ribose transport system permease protein
MGSSAVSMGQRQQGSALGVGKALLSHNTLLIFAVLVVVSSLSSDVFLTSRNVMNLLRQVAAVGVMSMGMLLVILTGGIDLSIGSVMALSGVVCAMLLAHVPLPLAVCAAVVLGVGIGYFSGYMVAKRKLAAFITTLAVMTVVRGVALIVSRGTPVLLGSSGAFLKAFARKEVLGVPQPVWVLFCAFVCVAMALRYTAFGRIVLAVGSNEHAVRLSGIRCDRHKMGVYAFSGACAAVAGLISAARTGVGSPVVGMGIELDVIAAVVIGGASLSGGKGTAFNTLMGVFILGVIGNVMNLMSVPGYHQQVVKGVIIIAAVLLQGLQQKVVQMGKGAA